MDLGLKDKRALVMGASRGLAYATAHLLAKEGCRVAINGRDEAKVKAAAEKIAKETGASVSGLAGDVSDPAVSGLVEVLDGLRHSIDVGGRHATRAGVE